MFTLLVLQVINFYMNLWWKEIKDKGIQHFMHSVLSSIKEIKVWGLPAVKRWTKGVSLFEQELILVPIHRKVHWSLVVSWEA